MCLPETSDRPNAVVHQPGTPAIAHPMRFTTSREKSGLEVQASVVLLDDEPARQFAGWLGLRVVGTAGVLLAAKERGLIRAVRPHLDALHEKRFFLSDAVYEIIASRAGET